MIPPRIKNIELMDNFCIKILYINGEKKIYDMNKNVQLDFYKKLKNKEYFKTAKSVGTTIEWNDGEDIDPNELYSNSSNVID